MPLKKGSSAEAVSSNIKELVRSGHAPKQAIAIALTNKRKFKKMAEGGLVDDEYYGDDFDAAGTPEPEEIGDENKFMSDKPSAAADLHEQAEEDDRRSLLELDEDSDYDPSAVASPMMEALQKLSSGGEVNPKLAKVRMKDRYAMGGLVEDDEEEEEEDGNRPTEMSLEGAGQDRYAMGGEVSKEAMEAIRMKKMKRRSMMS